MSIDTLVAESNRLTRLYNELDKLTKLICLWFRERGVSVKATKSVYGVADVIVINPRLTIHQENDGRVVVYQEGYDGRSWLSPLSGDDANVSYRVAAINVNNDYKWVSPHDPGFFSDLAAHLGL